MLSDTYKYFEKLRTEYKSAWNSTINQYVHVIGMYDVNYITSLILRGTMIIMSTGLLVKNTNIIETELHEETTWAPTTMNIMMCKI